MSRCFCLLLMLVGLTSTGCAICSTPDDCMYAAYGGTWQRDDMCCGRVGSVFAPAGGPVVEAGYDEHVEYGVDSEQEPLPEAPELMPESEPDNPPIPDGALPTDDLPATPDLPRDDAAPQPLGLRI